MAATRSRQNKFIEALSDLSRREGGASSSSAPALGAGVESDWMVTQEAPSNEVVVRINLTSPNLDMEKLYLPPVKAEKAC